MSLETPADALLQPVTDFGQRLTELPESLTPDSYSCDVSVCHKSLGLLLGSDGELALRSCASGGPYSPQSPLSYQGFYPKAKATLKKKKNQSKV